MRASPNISELGVVTVTYRPDLAVLQRQISTLPESSLLIVVDNASDNSTVEQLRAMASRHSRCVLIENRENRGLAEALNQGIQAALANGCRYALLLDQDTEPHATAVAALFARACDLNSGTVLTCVGPSLQDIDTGLPHGFHVAAGGLWRRRYPRAGSTEPILCSGLNGSGTLFPLAIVERFGGMDASLFIDHVDSEWSFRIAAAGCRLAGIPEVIFGHRMGQSSMRYWFLGWRVAPYRSPERHFFLFRNTIGLMRRRYVPLTWKVWAPIKLMLTMAAHLFMDKNRTRQLSEMQRGIGAGFRMPAPQVTRLKAYGQGVSNT